MVCDVLQHNKRKRKKGQLICGKLPNAYQSGWNDHRGLSVLDGWPVHRFYCVSSHSRNHGRTTSNQSHDLVER